MLTIPVIVHHWYNYEDVVVQIYMVISMSDQSREDSFSRSTSQTAISAWVL